jgi:pescadillo
VRRAAGRNEIDEANRKNSLVPTYTLHHLVKERYPRFSDALGDIDDALSLTYLFAALPGHSNVSPSVITKAKTLAAAWGAYCATTSAITKSFISVKGVYMEAAIQDTVIRWVIPHAFTQHLPEDVDFRIMRTFLEFYETMLNFVMFKLYNDAGVRYPFSLKDLGGEATGSTSAVLGANLRALTNALDSSKGAVSCLVRDELEKESKEAETVEAKREKKHSKGLVKAMSAALGKLAEDASDNEGDEEEDDDGSVDVAGPLHAALENIANEEARASVPGERVELSDERIKRRRLFEGLTFFLSREIPRGYLEIISLAFGAKVGWEGNDSPVSINDPSVTHHIVDRPKLPSSYESLPKSREYVQPQWILDCANFLFMLPIAKYTFGATLPPHLSPWVDDEEEGYKPAYAEEIERLKNGEVVDDAEDISLAEEIESTEKQEDSEEDIDANEEETEEDEEHDEDVSDEKKNRREMKRKKEDEESHALAKTMMSRKASHLYGRMQHGLSEKQAKVESLQRRRRELENGGRKDAEGRTALKQKVVRLKGERKEVEKMYSRVEGTMKKSKKRRSS